MIFVIIPSIIWFYYLYSDNECNSPVDNTMSTICIFYYIIIGLFIIYTIVCIFKFGLDEDCIKMYLKFLYLIVISILSFIMVIIVQVKYCNNWENNSCNNLKGFILAWLICNYIQIILHLLIFSYFCCECCSFLMYDDGD